MTSAAASIQQKALKLSAKERIVLAIALWESANDDSVEVTANEIEFAMRRLAEHKRAPDKVIPWSTFRKELLSGGGR